MSPNKRHGSEVLQRAAWAALLLTAATVIGCNQVTSTIGATPESGPDPSYRDVIAGYLKDTFKDRSSYEAFEISTPRWVHSLQGWKWLTCVRFSDHGHRRTYVVFLDGNTVRDDSRYAVQTDQCDMQAYTVFEQMGGSGLPPIH